MKTNRVLWLALAAVVAARAQVPPSLYAPPSMISGTIPVGQAPSVVAVNPATHKVYVANEGDLTLSVLDGFALKVIATLPVGIGWHALAINPNTNRVYVANLGSSSLTVVDGAKDAVIATVTVGSAPDAVVVDSATNTIYVANNADGTVSVVSGSKNTVTATLNAGTRPQAMALNTLNHKLYIASYDGGTVTVIDAANNNATTTVTGLGQQLYAIAVDPSTDSAYVLSQTGGTVTRIDGANGYATTAYSGYSGPFSAAVSPGVWGVFTGDSGDARLDMWPPASGSGHGEYVLPIWSADAIAFDSVAVQLDIASHFNFAMALDVNLDPYIFIYDYFIIDNPYAIAVDPVTHRSFITNQQDNTLTVMDGTVHTLLTTPPTVNMQATAMDVNPVSNTFYYISPIYQTLTAVSELQTDGNGYLVTHTVPVGAYPASVAVNPVTNKIYVPNRGDGTISVVDGDTYAVSFVTGLPMHAGPNAALVNPAANRIYVTDSEFSSLYVIDGNTDSVISTLATGPCGFAALAANPATGKLYIPCYNAGAVDVIDETSNQLTSIPLPAAVYLAVNSATNQIFVITQNASPQVIKVIDGGTNQITGSFSTLYGLNGITVNPATNKVYVIANNGADGSGHALVYDGATYALLADVPTTRGPAAVTVNPLANLIYVAGTNNNYLTIIDGASEASEIVYTDGSHITSTGGSDALALDRVTNIVSAAGYGSVTAARVSALFFPTPTVPAEGQVPIAITVQGVVDSNTIATTPLYRTSGTSATFVISAQSSYTNTSMVPQRIFYQLDGWQGVWQPATQATKAGANPAKATVTLNALTTGLHYLYAYAAGGDGATVQGSTFNQNSSVISPIQGAVFSVETQTQPANIAAVSGSNQEAGVNQIFAAPLVAQVTDGLSNPMPGVTVTFTAPASGASATFSGLTSATAVTDSSGDATSPVPAANGTTGTYVVVATVSGVTAPADFTLTNNNAAPAVTLSPASLNLGSAVVGTSAAAKGTKLTNSGTAPLAISSITVSGDYSVTDNCPATLAPAAACTIVVTFTPSVAGSIAGAVTVADNAANSPQVVALTGAGVNSLAIKPASLSFGTVAVGTTSAAQTLTLTNNSATAASVSFAASAGFSAAGAGPSPCGASLPGKTSCTIAVTFTPPQNGAIDGSVAVSSPSLATLVSPMAGSGSGGSAAKLTFSPASLTFSGRATGTTSAAQTVTVTNAGAASVTIKALKASADFTAAPGGTTPCGGALAAHASCTFKAAFTPSVTGMIGGSVAITVAGSAAPVIYDLSGAGTLAVSLSPASLTFAAQTVGSTSAPQTVTVTNHQPVALTLVSLTASGSYAAASGGPSPCGASVAAMASCTFQVTFTPSATGTIHGAVTVTHNAAGSPQAVAVTGQGM